MYISVYDLGLFILFLTAIAVAVYLIAVLRRAFGVLGHVQGILDAHAEDIGKTLVILPEVLENINGLTERLESTFDHTSDALCTLQSDLVDDLRDGLETFAVYFKIVGDIFRAIFSKSE